MNEVVATASHTEPPPEVPADGCDGLSLPIAALLAQLSARQVRYCHWKSNIRLRESLTGWGDLDLLVDRLDADRFFAALADAGFRMAQSRAGLGHPGVVHAFALDPHSLRLAHVHAYFQVLTGNRLVKPYRLPLEALLLNCSGHSDDVPIPDAEVELIVFLLRIALKHTSPVETVLVNRHYATRVQELAWLRSRANEAAASAMWQVNVPGPADDTFDELLHALRAPAALFQRIALGLRLAWRLRAWRRLGPGAAFFSRLRRFTLLAWCRIRGRCPKTLVSGGGIVALVGPRASGKSTLAAALADCIGRKFEVRCIHVGKPPATLLSAPVRPLLRRLIPAERSSEYQKAERRQSRQLSLDYVCRPVLLAYDRRALLLRGHRWTAAGAIVIAECYLSMRAGAIDSSQFDDAAGANCRSRLKRRLMRLEREIYRQLPRSSVADPIRKAFGVGATSTRAASSRECPRSWCIRRGI